MRVIIQGNWAPYIGTDYCDALGIYDSLKDAQNDAEDYAWDMWEGDYEAEESGIEDEGPDFWISEYEPEVHDRLKAGGGSFEEDFAGME